MKNIKYSVFLRMKLAFPAIYIQYNRCPHASWRDLLCDHKVRDIDNTLHLQHVYLVYVTPGIWF